MVDLTGGQADVAIRVGPLPDSGLRVGGAASQASRSFD